MGTVTGSIIASIPVGAPPATAFSGLMLAAAVAFGAALALPGSAQSKFWGKAFGGVIKMEGKGRAFTFITVLIVMGLLSALLIWLPTHS